MLLKQHHLTLAKILRNSLATQATAENVCATVNKPEGWDNALPFEAIPGPKGLPIIGNVWRFLPLIGPYSKVNILDIAKT